MSALKFNKAFVKIHKPRQDVIEFVGKLHIRDMMTPQVAEYTYTGKETAKIRPHRHKTIVQNWGIEQSRRTYKNEILEVKGNYIKFQFRLTGKEGWSPDLRDPEHMNMRVFLYANMDKKDRLPTPGLFGSKRSKVYHKADCYFCKRIKKLIEITDEEKAKRRLCKRE